MVVEDFAPEKTPKHPVPVDESGIMLNFIFAVICKTSMQIMKQERVNSERNQTFGRFLSF